MSFSWTCTDKNGKDLFDEFKINDQALGLSDGQCPRSISDIRNTFYAVPYKDKLPEAAQDALNFTQALVLENLNYYNGPAHPECPCCRCTRVLPTTFSLDIEQARRFISIPLTRVWRASASW